MRTSVCQRADSCPSSPSWFNPLLFVASLLISGPLNFKRYGNSCDGGVGWGGWRVVRASLTASWGSPWRGGWGSRKRTNKEKGA